MLLRYAQMMRARFLPFFDQKRVEGQGLRAWTLEEIGADQRSVNVKLMTPESLPAAFVRNWTINQMRTEIQKGFPMALRLYNPHIPPSLKNGAKLRSATPSVPIWYCSEMSFAPDSLMSQ